MVPYAVTLPGVLRDEECDEIVEKLNAVSSYEVAHCDAITREIVSDSCLDMIETVARKANDWYFKYDLYRGQHSWMQTYMRGDKYQRHMDGSPGQTRKLTAVAMLSHPLSYDGGNLAMYVNPRSYPIPRTRGTIVVFQHWVEHEVTPVTDGLRQTINMGFWGPPFK
jgi:predicted 2-oxoglutarate/Fe(II)-dependent dioxygenase YbiX